MIYMLAFNYFLPSGKGHFFGGDTSEKMWESYIKCLFVFYGKGVCNTYTAQKCSAVLFDKN